MTNYWGKSINDITQFNSSESRATVPMKLLKDSRGIGSSQVIVKYIDKF